MRNTHKKLALPVLAAASAALSAGGLTSIAKADFSFTYTQAVSGTNNVFVLYAKSDGLNSTGTVLTSLDVTVAMTYGAMAINQTVDLNGDGVPDADNFGATAANPAGVLFGSTLGTFIRVGNSSSTLALVYAQGKGEGTSLREYPGPQGYLTHPSPSGIQAVNPRYSSLISLEIVDTAGSADASTGNGAPFCNLVVPFGSSFAVTAVVAGSGGNTFTDTFPAPAPINLVSLTSSAPTIMGSPIASLTVTGGNGKYTPALAPVSGLSGYSKISGFSPTTDTEIFLIKFSSNADDTQIINDINSGGSLGGLVAQAPTGALAGLGGVGWDIELIASSPATPNGYFGFNFTDVSGITVTEIAAVPEPTAVGLLTFSGVALLARRRRQIMPSCFQ